MLPYDWKQLDLNQHFSTYHDRVFSQFAVELYYCMTQTRDIHFSFADATVAVEHRVIILILF